MRINRLETELEIKAVGEGGEIEGYGSVYEIEDQGGDVVASGAFAGSLAEYRGASIPMLWQHDVSEPIGMWTEAEEDSRGLRLKGRVLRETTRGRDAYAFLKHGAVRGLSIGFNVKKAENDRKTGTRRIVEAKLWEVSVVTFPMNSAAQVDAVKFCDAVNEMTARDLERTLRDAGLSAREAKAAISRAMDLGAERDAGAIREAAIQEAALAALLKSLKNDI